MKLWNWLFSWIPDTPVPEYPPELYALVQIYGDGGNSHRRTIGVYGSKNQARLVLTGIERAHEYDHRQYEIETITIE